MDGAFGRSLHGCAMAVWKGVPTKWETHGPGFLHKLQTKRCFRWMLAATAFRGLVVHCEALKQVYTEILWMLADDVAPLGVTAPPDGRSAMDVFV